MSLQSFEFKDYLIKRLQGSRWVSSRMALWVFLLVGLVLSFSVFLVLQSFIQSLIKEERARISQSFVEEVVFDIQDLGRPLDMLSSLISLSKVDSQQNLVRELSQSGADFRGFSQLFWFYRNEAGQWTYLLVSENTQITEQNTKISPDGSMLSALLKEGADKADNPKVIGSLKGFEPQEERKFPHIVTGPFALAKAVKVEGESKGFLLGVVLPTSLFNDEWLRSYRNLFFVHLKDSGKNQTVFLYEKQGEDSELASGLQQIYEFPFADRKWEITSSFITDRRGQFLEIFPYVILFFGLILSASGSLYIRSNFTQAQALAEMNEILEQKNYELKSEVAERERLNQALRDAEAENRAVIDAVGDIIFETNRDGQLIFLNRSWEKLTGFEIEQSLGQEIFLMIHPQDQQSQRQDFKNLLKGNKREIRAYTQLRTSDGTFIAVELVLSAIQQDRKGLRVVGTLTNIEERRRAERALSEAEKKYRNIVENAAGGIYQLTPEGLFLSANPALARILLYETPEQLLREVKNANEFVYPDTVRRMAFYRELENREIIHNHETQMRRRDGVTIWVNENARAVKDENGQILFIEGSIEDITQRKQSDEAIREAKRNSDMANRAKSEFISNMSHELRTPLNSIIGFSEMIKSEVFGAIGNSTYKEYAKDINESGQKLLRVINEILDISKIEAGERQLNEGLIDIRDVVDSAMDILHEKIVASRMIVTQSMESLPEIIGEELAMKQIVLNLLSNAVKFTPDGGRITISAHIGKQGRFHLSITDTGIGLDDFEIKKALSPFGQLNNSLSRNESGTGLGLTLVDALVKLHGGDFEMFSQKGIGTTATVIFPADRVVKKKERNPALLT